MSASPTAMTTIRPIALAVALCVVNGIAQGADSPAQAGYCVQYLRSMATMSGPIPPLPPGATPEAQATHEAAVAAKQKVDAMLGPLFDQWRLYVVSLLSQPDPNSQVMMEIMRGTGQANADLKYLSSQTTDVDAGCTKSQAGVPPDADAVAQCMKKAEEADPMMAGIRERAAPCGRGPSL